MTQPVRIQRKRTPGWKMPPNTVYVGRPSRYGNPWTIRNDSGQWLVHGPYLPTGGQFCGNKEGAALLAVKLYRREANRLGVSSYLRGKNLACWCPLDQPCHADVLLKLANAGPAMTATADDAEASSRDPSLGPSEQGER